MVRADPVRVQALGELKRYGKAGPFRSTNCRPCPLKSDYQCHWDITRGRGLEVRDFERQPFEVAEETEIHVIKSCGERTMIEIPETIGGHGGGDDVLRDRIFRRTQVAAHLMVPDSRAGAMSCLTGIAARRRCEEGLPVEIPKV